MSEELSYKEWAWQEKVKRLHKKEKAKNEPNREKRPYFNYKKTQAYQDSLKKEVSKDYVLSTSKFLDKPKVKKRQTIQMAMGEFDYLKYYKIVIYWASKQYGISKNDLEFLFFLYNERPFTRAQFEDFCYIMVWDKNRFNKYIDNGYIEEYAKRGELGRSNSLPIHKLTYNMRRKIRAIYDRLNLNVLTSESSKHTKIFQKKSGYNNKRFAKAVTDMNERARSIRNGDIDKLLPDNIDI
jgi:hypothetical protein